MKKIIRVLFVLIPLAALMAGVFIGNYERDKEYEKQREQRCVRLVSFAVDAVEKKGLSIEGASEFVASNIWAAHELCDDPKVSAKLNDLWNTLVFEKDAYIGQEEILIKELNDIIKEYN